MPNKSSPHGAPICEGAISSGTLRTQDLLRTFANTYESLLPFNSRDLCFEAREAADACDKFPDVGHEGATDTLYALIESLDALAVREGLTFGTLGGDGACFGFWGATNDEDELLMLNGPAVW